MSLREKSVAAALVLGIAASCSVSDVGEVASRKSILSPPALQTGALPRERLTSNKLQPEVGGVCTLDGGASQNANLQGLGRVTPAPASSARIGAQDMVSLRLRSVFVSNNAYTPENALSDFGLSSQALGETSKYVHEGFANTDDWLSFDVNLEIVVAVNAFDYGSPDGGFRFDGGSRENAKVIFYSEDVEEGQFLNLDNLPIVGPVAYSGAGFGLQLYMLEIDAEDEQQKALLKSLAGVGVAAAGLTGPGAGILNTLTTALVDNGNADDRMFDYAVGFDTGMENANVDHVPFEANLFAFVVDHNRDRSIPWHRLALNAETAELFTCNAPLSGGTASWQLYDASTYMVVQVLKGFNGQAPAQFTQQSMSDLTSALQGERGTDIESALDTVTTRLQQKAHFETARGYVGEIAASFVQDPDPARAQYAAYRLASLMTSRNPSGGAKTPRLAEGEFDYLLGELYKIAVQKNGGQPLGPASFPTFDPTRVGLDGEAFYARLKAALGI